MKRVDLRDQITARMCSAAHDVLVADMLRKIASPDDLVRFIHRYTLFNGNFAGGVSNLAAVFHVQQDLFRDRDEPIAACADRSARIASAIFLAAEDEYADRDDGTRITHRDLGQDVLRGTVAHFGCDPRRFDQDFALNAATRNALDRVLRGYAMSGVESEDALFRGLGFHIASELSADQEFKAIDDYLKTTHPDLVERLMSTKTHLGQPCYRWVGLHTFVELEHLDGAFAAADLAIRHYVGEASRDQLEHWVLDGVRAFSDMLRPFVRDVLRAA